MVRSAGKQVPFPSIPPIARKRATRYVQADWHELADHYSSPLSPSPAPACRRVSSSVWRALKCPGALPDGFPSLHRLLNPPDDFLFCLVASHHHQMNSASQLRGGHGIHFPLPTNASVPPALMDITVMHRAHAIKTSWIKYSKIKCSSRARPYNKLGFQFSVLLLLIHLSVFLGALQHVLLFIHHHSLSLQKGLWMQVNLAPGTHLPVSQSPSLCKWVGPYSSLVNYLTLMLRGILQG